MFVIASRNATGPDAMTQLPTPYSISFSPCTGFGSEGRSATIRDAQGVAVLQGGCGATDEEAVLETLTAEGWTFDAAFDAFYAVIDNAAHIDRA